MSNGVTIQGWKKLNGMGCFICTMPLTFGKADIINELYTVELLSDKKSILQVDIWADDMLMEVRAKSTILHTVPVLRSDINPKDIASPIHFINKLDSIVNSNKPFQSYLYLVAEIENDAPTLSNPH